MLLIFVNYDVHKLGSLQTLKHSLCDQVQLEFINFISQDSISNSFEWMRLFANRIDCIWARAVSKRFLHVESASAFQSMKCFHLNLMKNKESVQLNPLIIFFSIKQTLPISPVALRRFTVNSKAIAFWHLDLQLNQLTVDWTGRSVAFFWNKNLSYKIHQSNRPNSSPRNKKILIKSESCNKFEL